LEVVLRQLTGNYLTAQQRQLISHMVGCGQQYNFQLCQESGMPDVMDDQAVVRPIFGDTADGVNGPAAVLVCTTDQGEVSNTIYIYLPIPREEKRDDTR
jgi:hypothetical protein